MPVLSAVKTVDDLVRQMERTAFGARGVGEAAEKGQGSRVPRDQLQQLPGVAGGGGGASVVAESVLV